MEVAVSVLPTCDGGTAVPNPSANTGLMADCKTLLGLQGALAGTATLNWSAALAMSDWSGISTGGTPKRVIGVKLRNSGLGDTLSGALGDLAGLQDLWLNRNQLTGEIPAELGNLPVLEDLLLFNNQLTGSIPLEVASLEELRQLWITNNQLTGCSPASWPIWRSCLPYG